MYYDKNEDISVNHRLLMNTAAVNKVVQSHISSLYANNKKAKHCSYFLDNRIDNTAILCKLAPQFLRKRRKIQ